MQFLEVDHRNLGDLDSERVVVACGGRFRSFWRGPGWIWQDHLARYSLVLVEIQFSRSVRIASAIEYGPVLDDLWQFFDDSPELSTRKAPT